MAPFNKAVKVNQCNARLAEPLVKEALGRTVDYEGVLDPAWNIGNVPCGGYSLAIILESCIQHQAKTPHIDPLHIAAHFLRPTTSQAPFTVRVRTLKSGKAMTNLTADLVQEGVLRITAHAIFGVNGPDPEAPQPYFLEPPSSYARRLPLYTHPSQTPETPMFGVWRTNKNVKWAFDAPTLAKNALDHPSRTNADSVGGGGTEWAAWFQFEGKKEKLDHVYLPLLVDMFMNTLNLIPSKERGSLGSSWSPTITLAVEFKYPISRLSPLHHAQRTVGLYSSGRFITEPQGRHDIYVEVWSAPSAIGENVNVEEGWREKQICLAVATQMALRVPMAVNLRNGEKKAEGKL